MSSKTKRFNLKKIGWLIFHLAIILNFVVDIFHGFYQIFFVLMPRGDKKGPSIEAEKEVSPELIKKRRLFASETWIAVSGLAIYIAVSYRDKIRSFTK